jgi:hypothetical protein
MVLFGLNKNLDKLAPNGSLSDIVLALIIEVEAVGATRELIAAAVAENPRNPELQALAAQFLAAPWCNRHSHRSIPRTA